MPTLLISIETGSLASGSTMDLTTSDVLAWFTSACRKQQTDELRKNQ
jgi:hypothetical protein